MASNVSPPRERQPLLDSGARSNGSRDIGQANYEAVDGPRKTLQNNGQATDGAVHEQNGVHVHVHKHHNLAGLPAWRFYLVCASLWTATFLAAFDGTVVATLLSDIGSSFQAFNLSSWLGTAYLLSLCCFTPMYGRLSDALGRRTALIIALCFFTIGTAACAAAPTMLTLIAARVFAGIGGGGLTSVGSIFVSDLVHVRHRGMYQGFANIMFSLGASLGGPVGGWAADQFGWRMAFTAQIPLLLGSMAAVLVFIPSRLNYAFAGNAAANEETASWKDKLKRIDYLGSGLLASSVGCLLLGVSLKTSSTKSNGDDFAWTDPLVLGLLLGSLALAVLFVVVEARYTREPVLPLSLLTHRTTSIVAWSNLIMAACVFSMLYNLPLFFTAVKLQSSAVAGAHVLPYSVLIGFGSLTAGWIMRHTGRYYPCMLGSGLLIAISTAMMLGWTTKVPQWLTWVAPTPIGFGYAGALTSTLVAMIANVKGRGEIAVATSLTYLFRTLGQVLGVALSSAFLQSTLVSYLTASPAMENDKDLIQSIRRSTDVIRQLPPAQREAAVGAYAAGLGRVWWFNFTLAVGCVVLFYFAEDVVMPETDAPEPPCESDSEADDETL